MGVVSSLQHSPILILTSSTATNDGNEWIGCDKTDGGSGWRDATKRKVINLGIIPSNPEDWRLGSFRGGGG